jgi:hypothetical protein
LKSWQEKIEVISNLVILFVAITILISLYQLHKDRARSLSSRHPEISVGAELPIKTQVATSNDRLLVLVLSTQCHFCADGAPFYRQLFERTKGLHELHLIALFPQPVSEGKQFLEQHNIGITDVRTMDLTSIHVAGTPTLLLLNPSGKVLQKWDGKLTAEGEKSVWKSLQLGPVVVVNAP